MTINIYIINTHTYINTHMYINTPTHRDIYIKFKIHQKHKDVLFSWMVYILRMMKLKIVLKNAG